MLQNYSDKQIFVCDKDSIPLICVDNTQNPRQSEICDLA